MISATTFYRYSALFLLVLCISMCQDQVHSFAPKSVNTGTTAVNFQSETTVGEETTTLAIARALPGTVRNTIPKPSKKQTKILVEDIASLDQLKYFLEEDERPVVIKFYAKWCRKCQHVGRQFDRLAMEMGDRIIVDQQMIDGDVRFAAIEYNQESQAFITEELQVQGVPSLQIYVGTRKLLEGGSSIKNIRQELAQVEDLSHGDLLERVEEADDGVLTGLIEESFYDSPDFLNEEW